MKFKTISASGNYIVPLLLSCCFLAFFSVLSSGSAHAEPWHDPDFPGVDPTTRAYFSCTFNLKRFRMKHQHVKYSAFARGRAFTITGMKGCGMSVGQRSQAIADKLALKKCRKVARNPDKCYVSDRTIEK